MSSKNEIAIAKSICNNNFAFDFGAARTAGEGAIEGQAKAYTELGIKAEWIPTDKFTEGNVVHMETFHQIARGRWENKDSRKFALVRTTTKELARLNSDEKAERENLHRVVRRDTMAFLTQIVYCMRGLPFGAVTSTERKLERVAWQKDQRAIGGLLAISDYLSGSDKEPATALMLSVKKVVDVAIDELGSKSQSAKDIQNGYGQKYKGAFSVSLKK